MWIQNHGLRWWFYVWCTIKSSKQFGQFTLSICKHCQSIHVFHFYLCLIINYASCMKTFLITMYCININNLSYSICTLHVCVSLRMQAYFNVMLLMCPKIEIIAKILCSVYHKLCFNIFEQIIYSIYIWKREK